MTDSRLQDRACGCRYFGEHAVVQCPDHSPPAALCGDCGALLVADDDEALAAFMTLHRDNGCQDEDEPMWEFS